MTYETDKEVERFILTGIFASEATAENLLDELELLAETSGAEVVGRLYQNREAPHPAYYLGKGKLEELKELAVSLDATGIICDDELSPSQTRRMAEILDIKILDRTMVILDIFAGRAKSAEGKTQVELAQYKYRLSRLSGLGKSLSRLGGGIGTRGPGEKKLETDRRHIRNRIAELNRELTEIRETRSVMRAKREKNNVPVVSLAGYTNAGKSTLLNALTDADVLAEDKLFATLDTTTRKLELPNGREILFTDTVGFIQKLPTQLISAFRATLEELTHADLLVHVVDASNPDRERQMDVVYKTLSDLKAIHIPVITIFNKMDVLTDLPLPSDETAKCTVNISAKTGDGFDNFLSAIETELERAEAEADEIHREIEAIVPYSEGSLLNLVHSLGIVRREEHTENGTLVKVYASGELLNKLKSYEL